MGIIPDTILHLDQYCRRKGLVRGDQLGFGVHGSVFVAKNQTDEESTAVKAHETERFYSKELKVYFRLMEHAVTHVRNAAVPRLLDYDDELLIIEMTMVTGPFVLDFAGAYL